MAKLALGDRVEVELVRGGREIDGVVRGSHLETKRGNVVRVDDFGDDSPDTYVRFDDGDMQNCATRAGLWCYPVKALRVIERASVE